MKKDKKTIAFFIPSLEGGGAEKNIINFFKNLNESEYNVSLILAEKQGDFLKFVPTWVKIFDLKTKSRAYFLIFLKLIEYFKNESPDILVSAFPHFNIICLIAKQVAKSKTKIIITEHINLSSLSKNASSVFNSFISRFVLPFFVKSFYPKSDAIICVSNGVAEDLLKIAKENLEITVINNPIDIEEIEVLAKEPVDNKWFLEKEIPVLTMAGRLNKQKDYPTAFQALKLINKKRKVRLVVLGKGPEEQKLKELALNLGLSDKVLFLGFQNNPYKYISKSSIFVLSSVAEGFGNVLVEAMACGVPVISTDCPFGPNEIIENNENGILVSVGDSVAIANTVLKILDEEVFKNKLIIEGKTRAKYFSAKTSVEKYKNIFEKLCAE